MRPFGVVLASAMLLAGCRFMQNPTPGAIITCAANDDCPPLHSCEPTARLCTSQRRPVSSVALSPERGRAGTRFELEVVPDGDFAEASVFAVPRGVDDSLATRVAFTRDTDFPDRFRFLFALDGAEQEGWWDVMLDVRLSTGQTFLRAPLASFELDFSAPRPRNTTVRYLVASDNPLAQAAQGALAAAVTTGTQVELVVTLDEAAVGQPSLSVTADGPPALGFERDATRSTPEQLVFTGRLQPRATAIPQGVHALTLTVADNLGNQAERPLPHVVVDTSSPAAPDTESAGAIVYRRQPSGDELESSPSYSIRARPGAFTEPGVLQVFVTGAPVAGGRIDVDGGVPETRFRLVRDESRVFVRQLDVAGNPSPLSEVRDHEWVARLGPGLATGALQSIDVRPSSVQALRLPSEVTEASTRAWPLRVTPGLAWEAVTPLASSSRASALDAVRGGIVCLGRARDDLSAGPSSACATPAPLATEELTHTVFSGDAAVRLDDGPVEVPDAGTRTERLVAAAWDSTRQRGYGFTQSFTFVGFNSAGAQRRQVQAAGLPPPRRSTALAYDPTRDRLVLFGGREADGGPLGDTWVWRPEAGGAWVELSSVSAPAPRALHRLVFDPQRDGLLLVGGLGDGGLAEDLWLLRDEWAALDAGPAPARLLPDVAPDPARGRVLLTGGFGADAGRLIGAFALEGGAWRTLELLDLFSPASNLNWQSGPAGVFSVGLVGTSSGLASSAFFGWDGRRLDQWPIGVVLADRASPVAAALVDGDVLIVGAANPQADVWRGSALAGLDAGAWQRLAITTIPMEDGGLPRGVTLVPLSETRWLLAGGDEQWLLDLDAGTLGPLLDVPDPSVSLRTTFTCASTACRWVSRPTGCTLERLGPAGWDASPSLPVLRPLAGWEEADGMAAFGTEVEGTAPGGAEVLLRVGSQGTFTRTPLWRPASPRNACVRSAGCLGANPGELAYDRARRRLVQLMRNEWTVGPVAYELPLDRVAPPAVVARLVPSFLSPSAGDVWQRIDVMAVAGAGAGDDAGVRLRPWRLGAFDDALATEASAPADAPTRLSLSFARPEQLRALSAYLAELGFEIASRSSGAPLRVDAVFITVAFRRAPR